MRLKILCVLYLYSHCDIINISTVSKYLYKRLTDPALITAYVVVNKH